MVGEGSGIDGSSLTVTDAAATGTLIVLVLAIGGGLGTAVLVDTDDGGEPRANFSFSYFDDASALIVTHERGDPIPAGELVLTNGETTATWSEVAGTNETATVTTGDTIQLSRQSAFGDTVLPNQQVRVEWTPDGGNKTRVFARWEGR